MKKTYPGIDILKFIFACLIPLLHIPLPGNPVIDFGRQYLARLGVPFFFAASGFLLVRSMEKRGAKAAMIHHLKRVGKLLLIWLVIYSPLLIGNYDLRAFLFKTPAYLWYLTALLVAAIPFCLIKNRKLLWSISAVLYIFGTLMGGSYSWLTGGWPAYEEIFITTRNGLFFGLPLLCAGEISGKINKIGGVALAISTIALFGEIFFVQQKALPWADFSMYLLLPVVACFLLRFAMDLEIKMNTQFFRGASLAIYVMQYGIITAVGFVSAGGLVWGLLTWAAIIAGGCVAWIICEKQKILKHLFQ